ncbi:MAG: hypothetical protein J6W03_03875 [Bacteroidaceae bacterium]|nr:hypothetical protein [Bacteroidaceae bacterium]
MARKNYTTLPADYAVCMYEDCPMAASCLHQLAYATLVQSETFLHLISPRKCTKDAGCKFYRCSEPVRFARGFTGFQKKMFPEQYQKFMGTLIGEFGRNAYYERRSGKLFLPPREQETILAALRKAGVTEDLPFDHYEELINYCD